MLFSISEVVASTGVPSEVTCTVADIHRFHFKILRDRGADTQLNRLHNSSDYVPKVLPDFSAVCEIS
jgi:hypothetical protein